MNAASDWTRNVPPEDEVSRLRTPPHSVEAEQSLIGGLLIDNMAWDRVGDLLTSSDFYKHEHRLAYEAIGMLVAQCKPADVVTVHQQLREGSDTLGQGGMAYLNALAQSVPSAANIRRYAEIIREKALLRQLIALSDEAATSAFNPQGRSAMDVIGEAAGKLGELERLRVAGAPRLLVELVRQRIDRINDLESGALQGGMSTGIERIDEVLNGGLREGNVYILAARPSVGKSSLALQIGLHMAGANRPVLMLSQEMPEGEVADRALSNLGGVDYEGIQTGKLRGQGWERLTDAVERSVSLPFYVDDQPGLLVREIRAKARQVKGLKVLVIDYLQLAVGEGDNRTQEVGSVSRAIKGLAKQLGVAVLLLSQLSRKVEERASKEPELADLRDSGEIEQDADVVMFLWPAGAWAEGARLVGLKFDKNRQGRTGARIPLDFAGWSQSWALSDRNLPEKGGSSTKGGFE